MEMNTGMKRMRTKVYSVRERGKHRGSVGAPVDLTEKRETVPASVANMFL